MADFEFTLKSNKDLIMSATAEAIQTALKAIGTQAVAHAVAEITAQGAVDTGRLRSSITQDVEDRSVNIQAEKHSDVLLENRAKSVKAKPIGKLIPR